MGNKILLPWGSKSKEIVKATVSAQLATNDRHKPLVSCMLQTENRDTRATVNCGNILSYCITDCVLQRRKFYKESYPK